MEIQWCGVANCGRSASALGLCSKHYQAFRRNGDTVPRRLRGATVEERLRFHLRIGTVDECWEWIGPLKKRPMIDNGTGRTETAARVAYRAWVAPIPEGLSVLHRCDNPRCCNPHHLFVGTHADNMRDMAAKGRAIRTHCPAGHEYTEENIYRDPTRGAKHCRACRRMHYKKYRAAAKAARAARETP